MIEVKHKLKKIEISVFIPETVEEYTTIYNGTVEASWTKEIFNFGFTAQAWVNYVLGGIGYSLFSQLGVYSLINYGDSRDDAQKILTAKGFRKHHYCKYASLFDYYKPFIVDGDLRYSNTEEYPNVEEVLEKNITLRVITSSLSNRKQINPCSRYWRGKLISDVAQRPYFAPYKNDIINRVRDIAKYRNVNPSISPDYLMAGMFNEAMRFIYCNDYIYLHPISISNLEVSQRLIDENNQVRDFYSLYRSQPYPMFKINNGNSGALIDFLEIDGIEKDKFHIDFGQQEKINAGNVIFVTI